MAAGLDPKDAPCLLSVAAVVATGGGILSHLGLLAVESGKPAVIVNGRWETTARGETVMTFATEDYDSRERQIGAYRLVERHRLREIGHEIHDGDLVVVDADQGTLTLLGSEPTTLALHEALRQHAAACEGLERAGDDEVLVARGHHLRTRHQVEKAIARVTDPAVVRFAAEEILLAPAWAATDRALRDGVALLRLLTEREATAEAARAAMRNVTTRLAGRVREARAQATQHIPMAATAHDVLALRLSVLRLHDTLTRIAAALEAGGLDPRIISASGQRDLDVVVCTRLLELRVELVRSLGDERRAGGRQARLLQLQRVEQVLGIETPGAAGDRGQGTGDRGQARGERPSPASIRHHGARRRHRPRGDCGREGGEPGRGRARAGRAGGAGVVRGHRRRISGGARLDRPPRRTAHQRSARPSRPSCATPPPPTRRAPWPSARSSKV